MSSVLIDQVMGSTGNPPIGYNPPGNFGCTGVPTNGNMIFHGGNDFTVCRPFAEHHAMWPVILLMILILAGAFVVGLLVARIFHERSAQSAACTCGCSEKCKCDCGCGDEGCKCGESCTCSAHTSSMAPATVQTSSPVDILKRRLAEGEISVKEYTSRLKALGSDE